MKNILLAVFTVILLASCEMPKPEPPKKLKLVAKKEAVGSHYSLITKTQVIKTKYYLIFEDGSYEDVSVSKYMLAKVGTIYNVPAGVTQRD